MEERSKLLNKIPEIQNSMNSKFKIVMQLLDPIPEVQNLMKNISPSSYAATELNSIETEISTS